MRHSKPLKEILTKQDNVQAAYTNKYQEKLEKAAKRYEGLMSQGYATIEEMIEAKKLKAKPAPEPKQAQKPNQAQKKTKPASDKLPSYCKSLDEILKLDLIQNESSQKIAEIWNTYHSGRDALSASLDAEFYKKLHAKSKEVPMVFSID